MKQQNTIPTLLSLIIAAVVTLSPVLAHANAASPSPVLSPLLISEVQPGSASSASEEFVELYNTTNVPINLSEHEWQLEIAGSTATDWSSPLRTIPLSGMINAGQSYVVASQFSVAGQTVRYLPDSASVWYSAGLSAAVGHLRLTYTTNQLQPSTSCAAVQTVVDEAEWSGPKNGVAAVPSLDGRSVFLTAKSTGISAGSSLQRLRSSDLQRYRDTDSDAADFGVGTSPTPASSNTLSSVASAVSSAQPPVALPSDDCDPNPPVDPPGSTDPGSPVDPGQDNGPSEPGDGTTDTPVDPTPSMPAVDAGLLTPQMSELLPNPAAPQTDDADEFVELYNPNGSTFDLSGFILRAGTTTTHDYTFPDGTLLAPGSFTAFFSVDTGLSLSNSGGQVALTDPAGTALVRTDAYGDAKDGQAWAFSDGRWQWTTSPTPNAANMVATPTTAPAAKKTTIPATAKPVAKKVTAVVKAATTKASTTKAKTSGNPSSGQALAADAAVSKSPLHPTILAVIGVLAVLYGAYEYRHDLANYVQRLRDNRAARRKDRQAIARR